MKLNLTHFSPQQDYGWTCWTMGSESWRSGRRRDKVGVELFGPFDPLQSYVSPDSGSLESDPEWRNKANHNLYNHTKTDWNSRKSFSFCSGTLYGRKNSLLARRKLDRFPYLQYSTTTISGPGDTESLSLLILKHTFHYNYFLSCFLTSFSI